MALEIFGLILTPVNNYYYLYKCCYHYYYYYYYHYQYKFDPVFTWSVAQYQIDAVVWPNMNPGHGNSSSVGLLSMTKALALGSPHELLSSLASYESASMYCSSKPSRPPTLIKPEDNV